MRARARTFAAACALAAAMSAAEAAQPALPFAPFRRRGLIASAVEDALRGPTILPNGVGVILEGRTGILRTLELDDTTSLHVRVRIPF